MRKKTALITGGSRGIGRAIALDLAAQEWAVAIGYRQNQAAAQATLDAMQQKGGNGLALRADVSDPQAATFLVRQVEKTWGHLDALINTVGPYHRQNFFESSVESWHAMFDHNLHPVFYLCRAAAAGMQERKWGRIINFAVANADQLHSQPNVTAYY
ncbi:MAG: SDR family NAD(P)-dependent oxidoreductase, partial [candidate division KSB1 bacterium]|nr:SDR family NAD(P)-dependent oxidoreductase [candidate division KSB1 bacterium]